MNRKTRLFLLVHEEYASTTNPNDPMIDFYLDIMDGLWNTFTEQEIKYVESQQTVKKPSTDS